MQSSPCSVAGQSVAACNESFDIIKTLKKDYQTYQSPISEIFDQTASASHCASDYLLSPVLSMEPWCFVSATLS